MGRPGCEQCCEKPQPPQCLSCLHACEYAEVDDPALLEQYWNEKVYQPNTSYSDFGYSDGQQDFQQNSQSSPWGFNVTRTYPRFDPTIHPCNEDKFEYVVFVLNCQLNTEIPNGDYDICINGENLGTYYGSDMINPQDIPTFEGLPLFPFDSKHNGQNKCGPALYKHTIFGTSQEAIDTMVDTNFGGGWATMGGIGERQIIPPSERRTIADYNTYIVPKDPFLMDARDIVIDQSGNPSFGPKSGSFDIKFIPNPGINNLRIDLRVDENGTETSRRAWEYTYACAVPQGTIDRDDARGGEDGVHNYPVQWTPPSKVQVIIYSLERPIGYNQGDDQDDDVAANESSCLCNCPDLGPYEDLSGLGSLVTRQCCPWYYDTLNLYIDPHGNGWERAPLGAENMTPAEIEAGGGIYLGNTRHCSGTPVEDEESDDPVTAGFRSCTVANGCFCLPTEEELCDNFGVRPLCVNPFDSDNYDEDGQPKFISSANYDASTECTCGDDEEEYEEPESPGEQNAAPTCYYEADIFSGQFLGHTCFVVTKTTSTGSQLGEEQGFLSGPSAGCGLEVFAGSVDGDWKAKTRQLIQEAVDNAQDGPRFPDGGEPVNPGYAVRIMKALQAKAEEALALTNGCPAKITAKGYVGPFRFPQFLQFHGGVQIAGTIYGSQDGMFGNLDDVYIPFDLDFSYSAKALSDALASDITNSDGQLEFDGTCCAKWGQPLFAPGTEPVFRNAGGKVRDKTASFVSLVQTTTGTDPASKHNRAKWSNNLGRLLHMNPGVGTSLNGFNLFPCDEALVNGVDGDSIPLYMDLGDVLAATAPFDPPSPTFGFGPSTLESPLGVHEITREGGYFTFGHPNMGGPSGPTDRVEEIRIFPFLGQLNDEQIVYTLNDLSTGEYYFNVDSQCGGIGCNKPEQPEGEDPCLPCGKCIPMDHELANFLCWKPVTDCPPDPVNPCQPFAADPPNCPRIIHGVEEVRVDPDGNLYCNIFCDIGYVLEYDDVTGCAQCVQINCGGKCNYSWTGNSWQFLPSASTCPCGCDPPNIPGTFVGQVSLGTCVDDTAAKKCAQGRCWWTWFAFVGGGGEWRKNEPGDPLVTPSDCECRCDKPNTDGFAAEQRPTECYE